MSLSPPAAHSPLRSSAPSRRASARALALLAAMSALPAARAQTTFTESFRNATASGWVFGANPGDIAPFLTAATGASGNPATPSTLGTGAPIDAAGDGWLRLTSNIADQSTFALLDNQIFSVNARIQIEMEYAFWNGTGADGMTFFLVDGGVNSSTFAPGAYGGSMGYAQKTNEAGMAGGYLGFAFDNWGNYTNNNEGRVGGVNGPGSSPVDSTLRPNRIAVRGPDDGDGNNATGWDYIASSADLSTLAGGGQMDFPDTGRVNGQNTVGLASARPSQTGADYRRFRLTIDANNQLTVEMGFGKTNGVANPYITAFTADLSAYERPDTFKIGFTGATGSANEIHEIRNLSVQLSPWSTGSGAYEWDNGAGTTAWGSGNPTDEANANWFSSVSTDNNKTPTAKSDILFGNKPTNNPGNTQSVQLSQDVQVRNLTFDTGINYSIGTVGAGRVITFGKDSSGKGLPSINVNNYNDAYGLHKINADIALLENIAIRNFSYSTLCLNGTFETAGKTITVSGYGAVNFNGDISGSGDLVKNGYGIATINNDNSDDPDGAGSRSAWTGNIAVNEGMLVVTSNGALGGSVSRANNSRSNSGDSTLTVTDANAAGLKIGQIVAGNGNIPDGTTITGLSSSGGTTTITLSNALTGRVNSGSTITFAGATTVNSGGTLALRGGVNYSAAETIILNGDGITRNTGQLAGALHNDGGDNTLGTNVSLVLASNTSIGSRDGTLAVNGVVGQSGSNRSLTKVGAGTLVLGGANTYTGATIIKEGELRLTGSLSSGSNIQLAGGVLELGAGNTTASLGTGGGQIQFTSDGGFSAFGGARSVNLGNGTALTWASTAGFLGNNQALLLSSDVSNNTLTFQNAIDLAATGVTAQREIRVANGSAAVDAVLSGNLTDTGVGGLLKTGEGTLNLTGANDYTGATEIRAGALRGNLSANSNLQLNGGVRELGVAATTLALGAAAGQVRWTGNGGFAAHTNDVTLTLDVVGNANDDLAWASTGSFVTGALTLGSVGANKTLTLANNLSLGAAGNTRTIQVVQGAAAGVASGRLSGVLSGAANLAVTGNGRLDLAANNTHTGSVTVTGAELRLSGASADLAQSSGFTVRQGGALTLDNSGLTSAFPDRVGNSAGLSLNGGTLSLIGSTVTSLEDLGLLSLSGGANTINVTASGADSDLRFGNISRSAGATLDFTRNTGFGNLRNAAGFAYDDNILAYATINGADFVGNSTAYPGYAEPADASFLNTGAQNTWTTASTNAVATAAQTLDAARTINSLKLSGGADIAQAGFTLTLESGGLLTTGGTSSSDISGGNLTTGNTNELIVHAYNTVGTNISSTITGAGGLTKSGDGALTLSGAGANTYAGATTVNAGTLVLGKTAGVNAVAGDGNTATNDLVIGDGRGVDTVRLAANEQIANNAQVLLRGGQVGDSANVARLELNGATAVGDSPRIETFHTLDVSGNSVLDFGGGTVCSPTFLYLDFLNVQAGSQLTITNWIEFTDFLLVKKTNFDVTDLPRVFFDGYPGTASWKSYDDTWYQITPVPEPAAYGALALGGLVTFAATRRRRRAVSA